MLVVPEAPAAEQPRSSTVGGGPRQVRVPARRSSRGAGPAPHRAAGNHQKGFHKEHCDLDLVSRR